MPEPDCRQRVHFSVAADKLAQLITRNFGRGARSRTVPLPPRLLPPGLTITHTSAQVWRDNRRHDTLVPSPLKDFYFSGSLPDNPFLSVMHRYRFLTARRITEERTVVGVMVPVVVCMC